MNTTKLLSIIKETVNEALIGRGGSSTPTKRRYRMKMRRSLVAENGTNPETSEGNPDGKTKTKTDGVVNINPEITSVVNNR